MGIALKIGLEIYYKNIMWLEGIINLPFFKVSTGLNIGLIYLSKFVLQKYEKVRENTIEGSIKEELTT